MGSPIGLKALEHAENLAILCRRIVKILPPSEYRMADQLLRASDSVALNIAEGATKVSFREYRRFLDTSRCSLKEVGTAFRIIDGAGHVPEDLRREFLALFDEASRTLYGLHRSISERVERGEKRAWPRKQRKQLGPETAPDPSSTPPDADAA
jgi:four helix bundle protein